MTNLTKRESKRMSDQKVFNQYVAVKDAMEMLGYKSRTSIEKLVKKGTLNFILDEVSGKEYKRYSVAELKAILKSKTKQKANK